jgi:hypothetical protein
MGTPITRPVQVHRRGGSKPIIRNRARPTGRNRNDPAVVAVTGPSGVTRAAAMCGAQSGQRLTSASAAHASATLTGTSKVRSSNVVT